MVTADTTRWLGKAHTQTSDNDRLKRCKTNFKFNQKPSYCVAYVTGCVFIQQQNIMATKNGIGYSPLSDKVYLGKQNTEKGMWTGAKEDITHQFLDVSFAYFEENTIRNIGSSGGKENLFINVKNDKEGIEKIIKNLTKRLVELT